MILSGYAQEGSMALNIKRIEKHFGTDEIVVTPYSFTKNKAVAIPLADSLELASENPNQLCGCCVVTWDGYTIIRSSAIDTQEKMDQFLSLLQVLKLPPKQKLCSIQLDSSEDEWLSIASQHQRLLDLDFEVIHLNFPLKPLFISSQSSEESPTIMVGFENLSIYLNACSWIRYGYWFEGEMAKVRQYLKENHVDHYSLQFCSDEFSKEGHGEFLKKAQNKIDAIKQKIASIETIETMNEQQKLKLLFLQKDLLAERYELIEVLRLQKFILDQIVIEAIKHEAAHPFLKSFRQQAVLLNQLIGSQTANDTHLPISKGLQIILVQLLNVAMGIRTWSCTENGFEKTCFAYSLQLSILMMLRAHTLDELIHLFTHWNKEKTSPLAARLKKHVWENFVQLSLPFIQQTQDFTSADDDVLNDEWMEFFPGNIDKRQLVEHLVAVRSSYGK